MGNKKDIELKDFPEFVESVKNYSNDLLWETYHVDRSYNSNDIINAANFGAERAIKLFAKKTL